MSNGADTSTAALAPGPVTLALRWIAAALVAAAAIGVYALFHFRGLREPEAMDLAQLGRAVAEGEGFHTRCLRPAELGVPAATNGAPTPSTLHAPLYPLLLAAGFRLIPRAFDPPAYVHGVFVPEAAVIVPLGVMAALAAGLLVFLLGRRLFERRTAFLGAVLFLASPAVFDGALAGTPALVVTALILAAVLAALAAAREGARWGGLPWLSVSGAWLGLAWLTHPAAAVWAPALLVLALAAPRRGLALRVVALVLAAGALVAPWIVRNVLVTGGPFGLAPFTALNLTDAQEFDRALAPRAVELLGGLRPKALAGAAALVRGLPEGWFLPGLFVAAFFFRFSRPEVRRLRGSLIPTMILLAIAACLYGAPVRRLFLTLWPFVALYAAAFFFLLLGRLQLRNRNIEQAVETGFVLLAGLPLALMFLAPARPPDAPSRPEVLKVVGRTLGTNEWLCSDSPWAAAWYGHRTAVQLPATVDDFYAIHRGRHPLAVLHFSAATTGRSLVELTSNPAYREWYPLLEGRIPSDFPLTHAYPVVPDQYLIFDTPRLGEP